LSQNELKFGNFLAKTNWLYEAIVTTLNNNPKDSGIKYNAAPMGVFFQDEKHLIIKPFITTNTFKNLKHHGYACINFTNNIALFYKAAIKKSELSMSDFLVNEKINVPFLKDSKAYFEVISEKISVDKDENRATIHFKITDYKILNFNIEPYARGDFVVLESIIHFTRINFLMEKDPKKGKKLISKILDYNNFIKRVYPNSNLEKIMDELVLTINKME